MSPVVTDPLWSSGHDTCLLNGKAAVRIRSSANAIEPKRFEYVTMNPLLPAKAAGLQPANVPLRNEV